MPRRLTPLVTGEFYHVYNRGVEKRDIFTQPRDYKRFVQASFYYQFLGPKPSFSKFSKSQITTFKPLNENKILEIICYCLMPNHFHFLVRQLKEGGISNFTSQLTNSYTKYFNTKYNRVGPLLQGPFKALRVESNEQLLHLSRYIHLNPIVSGLVTSLNQYPWSSYKDYQNENKSFCAIKEVLNFFPSSKKYLEFTKDQIEYGITLEILKHQALDDI